MGMYDTFYYKCPNCGVDTDQQTKLGSCLLDSWELGDKTSLTDGFYRGKDGCHSCGFKATFEIYQNKFYIVHKNSPKNSKQEMHWGIVADLGEDPDKQLDQFVEEFKKIFENEEKEETK